MVSGVFALAGLTMVGICVSARAMMIAPQPGPLRLVQADAALVGRVLALEDQDVEAIPGPGATAKVKYRVALVKVSETLKGLDKKDKDKDTVRIAFFAPAAPQPVQPGKPILIRPGLRRPGLTLQAGQEGLFYVKKHATESFYVAEGPYSFTNKENKENFAKEVQDGKKAVKLLANPKAGLKSKEAKDRLLTAGLLLGQYRQWTAPNPKTEPIDAEESKLILAAIAEGDWNQPFRFGEMSPMQLFNQLGLTEKDGWKPPQQVRNPQDFPNAAREWLREHRDSYRIQRVVPAARTEEKK
jgi:hypothetical protein